jgi:hypothetical protein
MASKRDYYEILGVLHIADAGAIRAAFHEFALAFHPDAQLDLGPEERRLVQHVFQRGVALASRQLGAGLELQAPADVSHIGEQSLALDHVEARTAFGDETEDAELWHVPAADFREGPNRGKRSIGLALEQTQFDYTLVTTDCSDRNSGNSRCGHEFGTQLSADEKKAEAEIGR